MNVLHIVYPHDMPVERKCVLLEEMSGSTLRVRITPSLLENIVWYHYGDPLTVHEILKDVTDLCIMFSDREVGGILTIREHGDCLEGKLLASRKHCGGKLLKWVEQRILPRRPYITRIVCRSSLQAVNFYAKYGFEIDWELTGVWIVMVKDLTRPPSPNVPMVLRGLSSIARKFHELL